ncbi:MAG: hypothetical protein WC059_00885 [Candidatus Paceibacterota bacterium]
MCRILILDGTDFVPENRDFIVDEIIRCAYGANPDSDMNHFIPKGKAPGVIPLTGYVDSFFLSRLASALNTEVSKNLPTTHHVLPPDPQVRLRADQALIDKHSSFTHLILVGDPSEKFRSDKRGYFTLLEEKIASMYGYEILIYNSVSNMPRKKKIDQRSFS